MLNENWRNKYSEELIQLFGDVDVLSFVRMFRLDWLCYVNRMNGKRKD